MTAELSPRIYVASLSDYNNGVLHGAWIDAEQDAEDIAAEVAEMLRGSKYPNVTAHCPVCAEGEVVTYHNQDTGDTRVAVCPTCNGSAHVPSAEEWAIHDFDDFGGIAIGESESFETVAAIATGLAEHGPAWAAYVDYQGGLEWADDFGDDYQGEWDSEQAYAENLLDDIGELKDDSLASRYFDYEAFTRDLFMSDYHSVRADGGNVYVFRRS